VNRRSMWGAVAVLLALAMGGAACGSGGKSKDAASAQAPEDLRAPAAAVTAGLGTINSLTARIAVATGADAKSAKELNAGLEPAWRVIEGTVRANDKDLYIRFEDDFAALTKAADTADGSKAQQAAADISEAVKAYLAKFPG
jgi:hypothetical protein